MIDHRREGAIHIAQMNNGANMVNPDWQRRMIEILDIVESDCEGEAGLLLTGSEKFFSSGLDVEVVMSLQGEDARSFGQRMMEIMRRLITLPCPSVAALNGHAFAAGAFLALACDYRVMRADRGWFCVSEVDVGVPIGLPMMSLLKAKVSPQVARDAALTGKRYPGNEALAAGFVDAVSDESSLIEDSLALLQTMATKERRIFKTIKKQLNNELAVIFENAG